MVKIIRAKKPAKRKSNAPRYAVMTYINGQWYTKQGEHQSVKAALAAAVASRAKRARITKAGTKHVLWTIVRTDDGRYVAFHKRLKYEVSSDGSVKQVPKIAVQRFPKAVVTSSTMTRREPGKTVVRQVYETKRRGRFRAASQTP